MPRRTDKSRRSGASPFHEGDDRRRFKEARSELKRDRQQRRQSRGAWNAAPETPDADILKALGDLAGGGTASQIARAMGIDDPRSIAQSLRRLVEHGQLLESRRVRYKVSGANGEHAATLSAGADGALLARLGDERDIVVHPAYTCGPKAGDVAQILLGEDGQGVVTRILRRSGREVVGTVNFRPGGPVLVWDNRREGTLPVRSAFAKFNAVYRAGDRVLSGWD